MAEDSVTEGSGPQADCWRRIGVWGDGSCSLLPEHIHCSNCPVFARSGKSLLDRELTDDYQREWQAALNEDEDGTRGAVTNCLVFRVGPEWLAFRVAAVREATDAGGIHRIPHRNAAILLGLTNVRGELQLAFSLEKLLGIDPGTAQHTPGGRIFKRMLVVGGRQGAIVFPVDEVHGVVAFEDTAMEDVPVTVNRAMATFTRALVPFERGRVGVLDDELLLHSVERDHL